MHNNYYFLRQLSPALQSRIKGFSLLEAFSQNKNELILGFASQDQSFYIKAHLMSDFCCLYFPDDFHRSRRNSVNLLEEVIGKNVVAVRQFDNERCFSIVLEDNYELLFKMHGNRSNILLIHNSKVISLFKNNLANDWKIDPTTLDRPIDQSAAALQASEGDYKKLFPTFGAVINQYIKAKSADALPSWECINAVVEEIASPTYYIHLDKGVPALSLLPIGEIEATYSEPIEAVNFFYNSYQRIVQLKKIKDGQLSILLKRVNQTKSYIKKTAHKLNEIKNNTSYELLGHIIMANMHNIPAYATEATLQNFYTDTPITIKLNAKLSPQKNAERYYRKGKNQKIELEKLESTLSQKREDLDDAELHVLEIEAIDNVRELKAYLKESNLIKQQAEKKIVKPYYAFHFLNYDIWVGKNAKNNDILTQKLAWKDDLWLHAKDVSGSHVVIKHQAGKPFPKAVIEKAAQIAAYYSKRKTDSLCPVIVTPKKHVRKPKGSAPGAVVVDKEDVILVTPDKTV